jgi:hypothetical protein
VLNFRPNVIFVPKTALMPAMIGDERSSSGRLLECL